MARLFKAYLSVDSLRDAIKTKHSSLFTGKDEKEYLSIDIWVNDKESEFGTIGNINLNPGKDSQEKPIKIANLKEQKFEPKSELKTPGEQRFDSHSDITPKDELPF